VREFAAGRTPLSWLKLIIVILSSHYYSLESWRNGVNIFPIQAHKSALASNFPPVVRHCPLKWDANRDTHAVKRRRRERESSAFKPASTSRVLEHWRQSMARRRKKGLSADETLLR